MIVWPPTYTIRKHRLTKTVKLIASKKQGLIISAPPRFSSRQIPALLEAHKSWIIEQIEKINNGKSVSLPQRIELTAMQQTWQVSYQSGSAPTQLVLRPQQEIVVLGKLETTSHAFQLLTKWLRAYAHEFLISELNEVSQLTDLVYHKAIIRDQATRWGSCNSEKTISLNYKLVFLPYSLARHIIIHELCHTKHLNHSPRFWQLVAKHDPQYQLHRHAMRSANQYIPPWI